MKNYKIIVPKVGASNELGTEVKLYQHSEVIEAAEDWQEKTMQVFVDNGWAMELKDDAPNMTSEPVAVEVVDDEPVRARNEKGQLLGDDPTTPEVNEAWEGGEAPQAKKTVAKKKATASPKKSTQKNK